MATVGSIALVSNDAHRSETSFFTISAVIMAVLIVAGFSFNLAMGRSTFAVPAVFHIHAMVFFSWVVLYVAQCLSIARGNVGLHRALGKLAYIWAPLMAGLGIAMCVVSLRRSGSPFFFDQNQFLFSNALLLLVFMALVLTALRMRRHMGWHRRLMMSGMAILVGPGFGRLLPMPFLIPYAWYVSESLTLIFPFAGIIADKRRMGRVHPAWIWSVGVMLLTQLIADLLAYSDWGIGLTNAIVAGTPGSARPMTAFLPPGL